MSLLHGRWRRQMSLLASGALDDGPRGRAEAHADGCDPCARDLAAMRAAVAALAADPARQAEVPIALSALLARVSARLDGGPAPHAEPARAAWTALRPAWAVAALGGLVAAALATTGVPGLGRATPSPAASQPARVAAAAPSPEPLPEPVLISDETLLRLERNLARERTAHFLSEAEDVLVTVASHAEPCARGGQRVDMADESRRSRELLARRSLLVELDAEKTPQAQGVLDDVEQVLRDVAALESCARPRDLATIHRDLKDRRLLMKIDLMTRELQG